MLEERIERTSSPSATQNEIACMAGELIETDASEDDWSSPGLMDTIRLVRGECHYAESEEPVPT